MLALPVTGKANPAEVGQWEPLIEGFPVPAVHSLLLHTNKILFFRGDGEDEGGVGDYRAHLLDLDTLQFESFQLDANIFCSGHSYLPDGRILVSGGEKEEDLGPLALHTYDPITERWNREPDMRNGRYYPTNVALGDGSTLIFAGRNQSGGTNPQVERFTPAGGPNGENIVDYLSGGDLSMIWYPRMHLLPNGKVFRAGHEASAYNFNPATRSWEFVDTNNYGERYYGTSVALPPGFQKIMMLGGLNRNVTDLATKTVEIIDLAQPSPQWRYTNPMFYPRMHVNVVILPTGKVFVAGGMQEDHDVPVYASEMFDPVTEQWTLLPPQDSARSYHSTSLLLPDARVMWLGAYTDTGGNTDNTAQIYSPAYLFQGYRPTLTSAPKSADYGDVFSITTPDAATIASVVLIRPSATTHSVNMEQRYVPLQFTKVNGNTLQVTVPTNPNVAPPGYYMLFLVDGNGVPAVAPFIRLGGPLPPNVFAGDPLDVILPAAAQLDGTVTVFGSPESATLTWSTVAGPGVVSFAQANAEDTTATFYTPGNYTLRLTATAAGFSPVSDTVDVSVYPEGRVEVAIAASTDDAEEASAGNMKLTSLDLEMLDYDSGGPHRAVGLRFPNVDIAKGTQIGNAYVQFTAAESNAGATSITIRGQVADNAPTFSSAIGDITSRATTSAAVSWSPGAWTAGLDGTAEATANIAPIIQQIVNRPGWVRGNSLVLMFTGTGSRAADSWERNPLNAPVLRVDPAGSQACQDGADNDADGVVDYPADPGCSSAADPSELEASRVCDDGLDNDGDNFTDYPADSGCVSLLDASESEFEAKCIDGKDNDSDGLIDFPADPGCADGNDNDERGASQACDDGLDNDADLLADFPADPGCSAAVDTSELDGLIVSDVTLVTGNNDAEEKFDGSITLTSSDLEMLDYDAGAPHRAVGLRFPGVAIPQGATIAAAYIQFTAATSSAGAANLRIRGEAAANSSPFGTAVNNLSGRATTTAEVAWMPPAWTNNSAGEAERSPDIAEVIQEIVDRPDWESGNTMSFFITGSGNRTADSYNAAPASAPLLHLEYATAAQPLAVAIDVDPWSPTNVVLPNSNDPLTVAVMGSSVATGDAFDFDVADINPVTLKLGIGQAATGSGAFLDDFNDDTNVDAAFIFATGDTGIFCNDTSVILAGETWAGIEFSGSDTIDASDCDSGGCHP